MGKLVQAKLRVGAAGDRFEREADAIAEAVVGGSSSPRGVSRGDQAVQRMAADVVFEVPSGALGRAMVEEEETGVVQRKQAGGARGGSFEPAADVMDGIRQVTAEGGAQLPGGTRRGLGRELGADFGAVRVHDDERSHRAAAAIGARAFTLGRHVVFGRGEYAPHTTAGRRLLVHELVHTIQQGGVKQEVRTGGAERTGQQPEGRDARVRSGGDSSGTPRVVQRSSVPDIQRADCNFYVFDSTDPSLGTVWAMAANALAAGAWGGYAIASGKTIQGMLSNINNKYNAKDCDCIEEIQFLSHGSSGNAMSITATGEEFTEASFRIPDLAKYGNGPSWWDYIHKTPFYRAYINWYWKVLTPEQRELVTIRQRICGPSADVYYRSCSAFQGKAGKSFAQASATFWRAKVTGHTKLIGIYQPGKKTVKPGEKPSWSDLEGSETQKEKKGYKPYKLDSGEKAGKAKDKIRGPK